MQKFQAIAPLRQLIRNWRQNGQKIAFVPTMGNLHAGHLSLVERARQAGDRVLVSIFVNPMQFGPGEDFARYPRTEERDAALLAEAGAHALFLPDTALLYPRGEKHCTRVEVPLLSDILCGASRPGHFTGVCTIVAKLFNITQPDYAIFGEKDYQQLTIIRRMVEDLDMHIEIIGVPTLREPDGLAMSSRNGYLSMEERRIAPALYRTLGATRDALHAGRRDFGALESEASARLLEQGLHPDYVSIRAARTLSLPEADTGELIVLGAAWLGNTRLIDNLRV
jgi:pantoate--beta-alanine ligase